jgi:hypothetical protein
MFTYVKTQRKFGNHRWSTRFLWDLFLGFSEICEVESRVPWHVTLLGVPTTTQCAPKMSS